MLKFEGWLAFPTCREGTMQGAYLACTEPLQQDSLPRSARDVRRGVLLISVTIGVVVVVLLCTSGRAEEYLPNQEPSVNLAVHRWNGRPALSGPGVQSLRKTATFPRSAAFRERSALKSFAALEDSVEEALMRSPQGPLVFKQLRSTMAAWVCACTLAAAAALPAGSALAEECLEVRNYGNGEYSGASFKGQDLRGAIFAGATVRLADLSDTTGDGSIDTFAQFDFANLRNSRWRRALMDRVTFTKADLRGADFTQAILSGSDFTGAKITGADFSDSLMDDKTLYRLCKIADGVNEKTGVATRDSLLCGVSGMERKMRIQQGFDNRAEVLDQLSGDACTGQK
eukprot:gnl/TRDRNA2_/TRDRNA2_81654_c0_seq1.p1 gnl/TRDRNA2_/TRDRNA2_81654_c0~~gnl/TRDRNA2_/TRDRNA2_81654_c0_seq1.p1  ORF type:complete len:342 (+),score=48.09 gnl/TRDRNA2_/TRDRNA2_81654_c0_seq1:6-1031(+)